MGHSTEAQTSNDRNFSTIFFQFWRLLATTEKTKKKEKQMKTKGKTQEKKNLEKEKRRGNFLKKTWENKQQSEKMKDVKMKTMKTMKK